MTVRDAHLTDADALARLWTDASLGQWPLTGDEMRARLLTPAAGSFRLSAEGEGRVEAALNASLFEGTDGGLRVQLAGERAHFTALLLAVLARMPQGTRQLLSVVREDHAPQLAFLAAAGFRNAYQSWGAHLDLTAFDFAPFAALEERHFLRGVEVERWYSVPPDHLAALHAIHAQGVQDAPRTPVTSGGRFEEATSGTLFVALRRGEPLAYTSLQPGGEGALERSHLERGHLETEHTATRRDVRGQELALLVKAAALRWAREQGYARASTGGSVANLPMLRVNTRLGYRPEPMWTTWVLEVAPDRER